MKWLTSFPLGLPTIDGVKIPDDQLTASLIDWAGGESFDPIKLSRGFLLSDTDSPNNPESYALPVCTVVGGRLFVLKDRIRDVRTTLSIQEPRTDVWNSGEVPADADVLSRVDERIKHYLKLPKESMGSIEIADSFSTDGEADLEMEAVTPLADTPGFDGYLIRWWVVEDRGNYFVPGSGKKTLKERQSKAPHLWQHDSWTPIGKHISAIEDDKGVRISVGINESIKEGMDLMSNLRFGTPMGLSVGFNRIQDREGTAADPIIRKHLSRYMKDVPVEEFRAITEWRWWEGSSVTFPAQWISTPDKIRSLTTQGVDVVDEATIVAKFTASIKDGSLTEEQSALMDALVAVWDEKKAAGSDHGKPQVPETRRSRMIELEIAQWLEATQ